MNILIPLIFNLLLKAEIKLLKVDLKTHSHIPFSKFASPREKYAMMFDEPVLLQGGWWYVAWARVSGPSSDCGSHGQASITTDDGYVFSFFNAKEEI